VEPTSDSSGSPRLMLSVSFEINFVKRTMFKSLIQKNVKSETKKWFNGYVEMLQKALEDQQQRALHLEPLVMEEDVSEQTKITAAISLEEEVVMNLESSAPDMNLNSPPSVRTMFETVATATSSIVRFLHQALSSAGTDAVFKAALIVLILVLTAQVMSMKKNIISMESHLAGMQKQMEIILKHTDHLSVPHNAVTDPIPSIQFSIPAESKE